MPSGQQPKSLDPDLPTFFLDRSVRRREVATALGGQGARLFVLTNANVTGKENVRRVMDNWSRIVARAKKPGPYVYAILPNSLEKRWPAN